MARSNREEPRSSSKKKGLLLALLFLIIVGVVVAVAVTQINPTEEESIGSNSNGGDADGDGTTPAPVRSMVVPTTAPTVTGFQACNGLESLCDVRANELLYATLHNAVSTVEDGVSFFANHDLKLETALVAGWRGLNFDIGKCDGIQLVHGACGLGTRDPVEVFTNIQSFLQDNPNEVLLMPVQIDDGLTGGAVTLQEIYAVMQQVPGFTDLLYQHTGRGTPWPTLRQLIAENTRILFFHYNGENCEGNDACPAGFHDWFVYAAETQFEFNSVADLQNTTNSCEITRGSSGERDFFGVNLFTRLPSDAACEILNAATFATNHVLDCSNLNGLRPAAVLVDCWDIGGILQAVDRYNVQLEAPVFQLVEVTMQMDGVSSEMSDADQAVFLATCSDFFAGQLTDLSNVYCSEVVSQQLLVTQERRRLLASHRRRQLDEVIILDVLQVTVQVSGDDYDASSLTSKDLETVIDTSGDELAQSLSTGDTFFESVTQVVSVTDDSLSLEPSPAPEATATDDSLPLEPSPAPEATATSQQPSTVVSLAPTTMQPSSVPSVVPSLAPTTIKSSVPSVVPSLAPTKIKSSVPSAVPSLAPSSQPSSSPTTPPTIQPSSSPTTPPTITPAMICNGLENLCDLPANDILFATVHNAASTQADGVTVIPNHDRSLEDALLAGYRGINLDIGKCDDEIQLVHGFCFLGTRDLIEAMTNIVSFLEANPNEVIVMPTQIDSGTGGTVTLDEIDAMLQQVPRLKDLMYNHDAETPWPTLRELIEANTRILFFHYNGETCSGSNAVTCPSGLNYWFQYAGESQFEFANTGKFEDKKYACEITRGGSGLLDFYGVNVFTVVPSDGSCQVLNTQENLANHIQVCSGITGQSVNLLVVDCWDVGDVLAVVREYNEGL